MISKVAPVAGDVCMLALQRVASLLVVESLEVPFDQLKVFAIVLGMAGDAFLV